MFAFALAALILIILPGGRARPSSPATHIASGRPGGLATVPGGAAGVTVHATSCRSFVAAGGSPRAQILIRSAIFLGLDVAWFGLYGLLVRRPAAWLRRPKVAARIERGSGTLLAGIAVRLAVSAPVLR
jgi:threonine/homoserine/homoserine lactone efflux protein